MITYKEANQICIKEYLQSLNIHPAKERQYYGMYHSPFRDDRNASMKVDYDKNLWIDYGTGEGGTMIDLVMRIKNCNFQEAIARLENMYNDKGIGIYQQANVATNSFFFHRNRSFLTNITKTEPVISINKVTSLDNPALLDYLKERYIAVDIANAHCFEVHYKVNEKPYYAIGFPNDSGGYELRNRYFKGCTSKDISSKTGMLKSDSCQLFEGFMDFLSFLTMQDRGHQEQNPDNVIILNSLSNLSKVRNTLSKYKSITAFLDNDDAGQKAVRELKSLCKEVDDRSLTYREFKDLNEYHCGKKQELNQLFKRKPPGFRL